MDAVLDRVLCRTPAVSEPEAYLALRQHERTCDECRRGAGVACRRGVELHDRWMKAQESQRVS